MQPAGPKCAARGSLEIQNAKMTQKSPSAHYRTTLSSYVFATKACIDNWKNWLNSNISSRCRHNRVNFGPLTAEIDWRVWGTPENFNGFGMLASLLQRRRSWEANQTLHTIFGRLLGWYTIYVHFRALLHHDGILTGAKITLRLSLAFCHTGSIIPRLHDTTGCQTGCTVGLTTGCIV